MLGGAAARGRPGGPRASRRPGRRPAACRRGPGRGRRGSRWSRSRSPGSSGAAARPARARSRSTRPDATSRATLIIAIARLGARSSASSSAGARAATAAGPGAWRRPQSLRPPQRLIIRRWMSTARPPSISCSVMANASASNGIGPPRRPQPGERADGGAQQRVPAEHALELRDVVVEAEREAHALHAPGGVVPGGRLATHPPAGRRAGQARTITCRPSRSSSLFTAPLRRRHKPSRPRSGRRQSPGGRTSCSSASIA